MANSPAAGLTLRDKLEGDPPMQRYLLYFAVRAELLCRTVNRGGAFEMFARALVLPSSTPSRVLLE